MIQKERKLITEEIYQLIISMYENEMHTFKKIFKMLKFNQVIIIIERLIKKHEIGERVVSANVKCKKTCKERNLTLNDVEKVILKTISCNNSNI